MSDSEESDSFDTDEIEHTLSVTTTLMESMLRDLTNLEARLEALHRPLRDLHVEQLGNIDFLASSPFRNATFQFKNAAVAAAAGLKDDKRYPYHVICKTLRAALIQSGQVTKDGTLTLNTATKQLFGVKEDNISYPVLLGHLRNVLI